MRTEIFNGLTMKPIKPVKLQRGSRLYGEWGYGFSDETVLAVLDCDDKVIHWVEIGGKHRKGQSDLFIEPITKMFGIGTYYDDEEPNFRYSEAEIQKALHDAEIQERWGERQEKMQEIRDEELRQKLIQQYSYLTRLSSANISDRNKVAANNIRTELKRNFPTTKFRVYKQSYDCYYIEWADGASYNAVTKIVTKYKDHETDISGDYRDYNPSIFNGLFGGINYIFCNREVSEENKQKAAEEFRQTHSCYGVNEAERAYYDYDFSEKVEIVQTETAATPEDITIENYSEKCFKVFGNTKPIKDELKQIGVYNGKMHCWFVSKKREAELHEIINK